MTTLETRQLEFRAAVDADSRTVSGVGVPYGEIISVWGQREMFAPGSVRAEGAKLFYRHSEPIGMVTSATDDDTGWNPTAKISATTRGDEAYQLARDGVLDGFSVGFVPVKWHAERDEIGEYVVYDEAIVREVSLCPFPYYPSARVKEVRHDDSTSNTNREEPAMTGTQTETPAEIQQREGDLQELREGMQDVQRSLAVLQERGLTAAVPEPDQRSAGEWLRALASGDEASVREYEAMVKRAYEGGTTADGILTPQYVGDTIRLFESPDPLSQIFATGVLPAKGMKLEHGVLLSDDVKVEEQIKEGDNLAKGSVKVGLDYAPIKTYGGYVELSRQEIERTTNVNLLDLHIRALGLRGARRKAAVLRAHYAALVAANAANPDRVVVVADQTKYLDWVSGIVDGAEHFLDLGLPLDALVVDKTVFKTLAGLSTNSRPLMSVYGDGTDAIGEISAKQLGGNLAGVTVRVNLKQTAPGAAFVNGEAIRQYNGPVTELSDENIVNLTKQFGLYYYAANATEIPDAIAPVVAAAPAPVDPEA